MPNIPSPALKHQRYGQTLKLKGSPRTAAERRQVLGYTKQANSLTANIQERGWTKSMRALVNDSLTRTTCRRDSQNTLLNKQGLRIQQNEETTEHKTASPGTQQTEIETFQSSRSSRWPNSPIHRPQSHEVRFKASFQRKKPGKAAGMVTCESLNLKQTLPEWLKPNSGLVPSLRASTAYVQKKHMQMFRRQTKI